MNEIVRESFKTTKKYIWKGVFCFLFYFAALYTLKDGILPIMAQTFPGTENSNATDDSKGGTLRTEAVQDLGKIDQNLAESYAVSVEGKEAEDFLNDDTERVPV